MDEEETPDLEDMFEDMRPSVMMAIHIHEIYVALQEGGFEASEALYIVTQMLLHDWSNNESE